MKEDETNKLLEVQVGERWPVDIVATVEESAEAGQVRTRAGLWMLGLFGGLLLAFAGYGMTTGNEQILSNVFQLVQYGVVALLSWILGRRVPQRT